MKVPYTTVISFSVSNRQHTGSQSYKAAAIKKCKLGVGLPFGKRLEERIYILYVYAA